MDLKIAEEMIKLMRSYGVTELEMSEGESSIKISTAGPALQQHMAPQNYAVATMPAPMTAAVAADTAPAVTDAPVKKKRTGFEVKSPFVGTFYAAPAPGEDDFVSVGQRVKKGDTLCIVEAMKLMNEIEAEKDGVISEITINNEEPVEFDQVLFVID